MPKRKKGAIVLEKGGPSSLFILSATNPIRWSSTRNLFSNLNFLSYEHSLTICRIVQRCNVQKCRSSKIHLHSTASHSGSPLTFQTCTVLGKMCILKSWQGVNLEVQLPELICPPPRNVDPLKRSATAPGPFLIKEYLCFNQKIILTAWLMTPNEIRTIVFLN